MDIRYFVLARAKEMSSPVNTNVGEFGLDDDEDFKESESYMLFFFDFGFPLENTTGVDHLT